MTLNDPRHRLKGQGTGAAVEGSTWARALPLPFPGTVDIAWLSSALADTSPDVLQIALDFVPGAPEVTDASGRRVGGDASYGPLLADGTRQEGADWNDYQRVAAAYPHGVVDRPEPHHPRSLDCSGYMRTVWGVHAGLPPRPRHGRRQRDPTARPRSVLLAGCKGHHGHRIEEGCSG